MHHKIFDGMYFVWIVFVIYRGAAVQGQPCVCEGGCDNSTVTVPGSGGRIVNVAYGKPARSTSRYTDGAGMSGPACFAVNGKTDTQYLPLNFTRGRPSCVHTSSNDVTGLWQVDLGRNYTVTDIIIYRREPYRRRMAGLDVTVDDQLCHRFPNSSDTAALDVLPEQIDITCSPPLTGRVVKLQKNGQQSPGHNFINVCEVQVWACKDGLYGAQCDQTCSGHCEDNVLCDNYYGTCSPGCTAGTHGYDCRQQCGQCDNSDTCNTVTGLCPHGCLPGRKGDNCKQEALSASKLVGPIAGAMFGGLCIVAVSVLVVGLILRRLKQRSSPKSAVPAHGLSVGNPASVSPVDLNPPKTSSSMTATGDVTAEENQCYDALQPYDDSDRAPYSMPVGLNGMKNTETCPHAHKNDAARRKQSDTDYYNV